MSAGQGARGDGDRGTPSVHARRLAALRRALARRGLDAVLISEPANRRYLSGYSAPDHGIGESSGRLLIPRRGDPLLLTDSRFTLQAADEAPDFLIDQVRGRFSVHLAVLARRLGLRRLGFESSYTLVSMHGAMRKALEGVDLVPLTDLVERPRMVKDETEVERLRAAVRLGEEVFQETMAWLRPGLSETAIALRIEERMRLRGAEGPSFPTIVAIGANAARPHAVPGDRVLARGDLLLIDMGLILDGYCSDMTRTVMVGGPDSLFLERLRVVRQAQKAAMETIRAGVSCREADQAARRVIREAGYGKAFGHALGHGVGLAVHEAPSLSPSSRRVLRTGMVVTVEPGIYIPGWGGIRLEDMVVVGPHGCENLNTDTTGLDL